MPKENKGIETRRALLNNLAFSIPTEDLKRIQKYFPYILAEAVRELNGEVEYIMREIRDDRKKKRRR